MRGTVRFIKKFISVIILLVIILISVKSTIAVNYNSWRDYVYSYRSGYGFYRAGEGYIEQWLFYDVDEDENTKESNIYCVRSGDKHADQYEEIDLHNLYDLYKKEENSYKDIYEELFVFDNVDHYNEFMYVVENMYLNDDDSQNIEAYASKIGATLPDNYSEKITNNLYRKGKITDATYENTKAEQIAKVTQNNILLKYVKQRKNFNANLNDLGVWGMSNGTYKRLDKGNQTYAKEKAFSKSIVDYFDETSDAMKNYTIENSRSYNFGTDAYNGYVSIKVDNNVYTVTNNKNATVTAIRVYVGGNEISNSDYQIVNESGEQYDNIEDSLTNGSSTEFKINFNEGVVTDLSKVEVKLDIDYGYITKASLMKPTIESDNGKYNQYVIKVSREHRTDTVSTESVQYVPFFDLALTKQIVSVISKENGGSYNRLKSIDTRGISRNIFGKRDRDTATYTMDKNLVYTTEDDIVRYRITVYNEGEINGYAKEIRDYLPKGLELVPNEDSVTNSTYGWDYVRDESGNIVTDTDGGTVIATKYLKDTEINAFNGENLSKEYVDLDLRVTLEDSSIGNVKSKILCNRAEISEYGYNDENGEYKEASSKGVDHDSVEKSVLNDSLSDNISSIVDKINDLINENKLNKYGYIYDKAITAYEDDDDIERIAVVQDTTTFDLALRKWIVAVDGKATVNDETIDRVPRLKVDNEYVLYNNLGPKGLTIATDILSNNGELEYYHPKEAIDVHKESIITYNIGVFNEGQKTGYANEITDYLPKGLELADSQTNRDYGWEYVKDSSGNIVKDSEGNSAVKTTYLEGQEMVSILQYYANHGAGISSEWCKTIPIECKVSSDASGGMFLTNRAEITKYGYYTDENKTTYIEANDVGIDYDSEQNTIKDKLGLGSWYAIHYDRTNELLYYPGVQDDDDYETVYVEEEKTFDLALRKWIAVDNDTRAPKIKKNNVYKPYKEDKLFDSSVAADILINDGELEYYHTKKAIEVDKGSTITYNIGVFNEGEVAGYAKEITDYLPAGLELAKNSTINSKYGWTGTTDGNGNTVVKTTYLEGQEIETILRHGADEGAGSIAACYKVIQIECTISNDAGDGKYLTNRAEITKYGYYTDEDKITYVEASSDGVDRDSTQDTIKNNLSLANWYEDNYVQADELHYYPGVQDDDDFETIYVNPEKKEGGIYSVRLVKKGTDGTQLGGVTFTAKNKVNGATGYTDIATTSNPITTNATTAVAVGSTITIDKTKVGTTDEWVLHETGIGSNSGYYIGIDKDITLKVNKKSETSSDGLTITNSVTGVELGEVTGGTLSNGNKTLIFDNGSKVEVTLSNSFTNGVVTGVVTLTVTNPKKTENGTYNVKLVKKGTDGTQLGGVTFTAKNKVNGATSYTDIATTSNPITTSATTAVAVGSTITIDKTEVGTADEWVLHETGIGSNDGYYIGIDKDITLKVSKKSETSSDGSTITNSVTGVELGAVEGGTLSNGNKTLTFNNESKVEVTYAGGVVTITVTNPELEGTYDFKITKKDEKNAIIPDENTTFDVNIYGKRTTINTRTTFSEPVDLYNNTNQKLTADGKVTLITTTGIFEELKNIKINYDDVKEGKNYYFVITETNAPDTYTVIDYKIVVPVQFKVNQETNALTATAVSSDVKALINATQSEQSVEGELESLQSQSNVDNSFKFVDPLTGSINVNVPDTKITGNYKINLTKQNELGDVLSGVKFNIEVDGVCITDAEGNNDKNPRSEITSDLNNCVISLIDGDGQVEIVDDEKVLEYHETKVGTVDKYTITEVSSAMGYAKLKYPIKIEIEKEENGGYKPSAVTIRYNNEEIVKRYSMEDLKTGVTLSDLVLDTSDSETTTLSIKYNGSSNQINLVLKNIPETNGLFTLKLIKYIKNQNVPLAGAKFKVTIYDNKNKKFVYENDEIITSATEEFITDELNITNKDIIYTVKIEELEAPDGYAKIAAPIEFNVRSEKVEGEYRYRLVVPKQEITNEYAKSIDITEDEIDVEIEDDDVEIHKGVETIDNQNASYNGDQPHNWIIESKVPVGMGVMDKYYINDHIDENLVYSGDDSVRVAIKGGKVLTKDTDYMIDYQPDTRTLQFIFINETFKGGQSIAGGQTLVITYNTIFARNADGTIKALNILNENRAELVYDNGTDEGATLHTETPAVHTGGLKAYKYATYTHKYDSSQNKEYPLAGAKFKILKSDKKTYVKDSQTNKDIELVSDENGNIDYQGLSYGGLASSKRTYYEYDSTTKAWVYKYSEEYNNNEISETYYLEEIEAPYGYIPTEELIPVVISRTSYDEEKAKIPHIEDVKITGFFDMEVIKSVKGTKPVQYLEGAKFKVSIVDEDSNELIPDVNHEYITGADGKFTEPIENLEILDQGKTYTVTLIETEAPTGYARINGNITFNVTSEYNEAEKRYDLVAKDRATTIANAKAVTVKDELISVEIEEDKVELHKGVEAINNQNATYYADEQHNWIIQTKIPVGKDVINKYVVTDDIDYRLVFSGLETVKVKVGETALQANTDYKVKFENKKLTVIFRDDDTQWSSKINAGDTVTITFNTTFAKDDDGNIIALGSQIPNQAKLTYDNGVNTESTLESEIPKVHTGGLKVLKYDLTTGEKVPLPGAKFKIATTRAKAESGEFVKDLAGNDLVAISDNDGIAEFQGIRFSERADSDTFKKKNLNFLVKDPITGADVYCYDNDFADRHTIYYVVEVEAPTGYIKSDEIKDIRVDSESYDTAYEYIEEYGNDQRNYDVVINKLIYGEDKIKLPNANMALVRYNIGNNGELTVATEQADTAGMTTTEEQLTDTKGMITINETKVPVDLEKGYTIYPYLMTELNTPDDTIFVNVLKNKGILVYLRVNYDGSIYIVDKDGNEAQNKYYVCDIDENYNITNTKDNTDSDLSKYLKPDNLIVETNVNSSGKYKLSYTIRNPQKYDFELTKSDFDTKKFMNGVTFRLQVKDVDGNPVILRNAKTMGIIGTNALVTGGNGEDGVISIEDILIEERGTYTFYLKEEDTTGLFKDRDNIFDIYYKELEPIDEDGNHMKFSIDIVPNYTAGRYDLVQNQTLQHADGTKAETITIGIKGLLTEVENERIKGEYEFILDKSDSYYEDQMLAGAEFEVSTFSVNEGDDISSIEKLEALSEPNKKNVYLVNDEDVEGKDPLPSKVVTDENGNITIPRIRIDDPGTYIIKLKEITAPKTEYAPNGYMKLDVPIYVKVTTVIDGKFDKARFMVGSYELLFQEQNHDLVKLNEDRFINKSRQVVVAAKNEYFDLALRKSITTVNYGDGTDDGMITEEDTKDRIPDVDYSVLLENKEETAIYSHVKNKVRAYAGQEVVYTFRVYNEGEIDAKLTEITDYLPDYLEFLPFDKFNTYRGWIMDETTSEIKLNCENNEEMANKVIKARDRVTGELDSIELQIKCKVSDDARAKSVLTNIAEITGAIAVDRTAELVDRDSTVNNVELPEDMASYQDDKLSNEKQYVEGQEDDDDFEKLIVEKFDLALRKYITEVDGEEPLYTGEDTEEDNKEDNDAESDKLDDNNKDDMPRKYEREPQINTESLKKALVEGDTSATAEYKHTKEPVEVSVDDIVTYTLHVYNEGTVDGYAKLIRDDIPEGLEFVQYTEGDGSVNDIYRWKVVEKDGEKYIVSDYLSKENEKVEGENLMKAYNSETDTLDSRFVKVQFKVIVKQDFPIVIENQAQISDDSDENGKNVRDDDSTPDEWIVDEEGNLEDDQDVEYIRVTYLDLALRKFITGVTDAKTNETKEITDRIPTIDPTVLVNETGTTAKYTHTKEPVIVHTNDIVVYTIRVYNEGSKDGYATTIKDDLPEGLEYLPDHQVNKDYEWILVDENNNEVKDIKDAKSVITHYRSKDKETEERKNFLTAFHRPDDSKLDTPEYVDVKIAFKVYEPETKDRILINQAQISEHTDKKGKHRDDRDSTPDEWLGEDDEDIEKVRVLYFDLALRKWVTKAIVTQNGETVVTETGHLAEDDPEDIVKVDLKKSKIDSVVVKYEYQIRVTNEGEIDGYAKEIKDYIPEGLRFEQSDNPTWTQISDNVIVTDELKDVLLEPGESTEVTVVLTWINSKSNLGLKVNIAEISDDYNDYDTPDRDSTPDNFVEGEDDIDDAPVLLTVKTGGQSLIYIVWAISIATIVAFAIYDIKKKYKERRA